MTQQSAEIDGIVTATLDALARRTGGVVFREDSDVAGWIRRQKPGLLLDLEHVFPPGEVSR